ncbi:T9SS type A sorting domain-containing protein [Lutibacter citreus]|uniref:T9SS type A sorting domain-containing protein n=1 Tax=Lutibacter citreus TaxID=2138210 RepID=UPI000DBE0339|nr:T9SS type A sorting domain-containing protein [Lutibacter citreus]
MKHNYLSKHLFLFVLILFMSINENLFAQTVFINEIHYDNVNGDEGEAIEIAGPAGTDLTNWSIVLYNGGNGAAYKTTSLSGSIPDLGDGYGVVAVNYPVNGIQNGAPDAIALVNNATVIQFISYEGSLTAVNGPAIGMTSTDIGVSETGTTLIGNSIQLIGSGLLYTDFTWQSPSLSNFGSINFGQSFSGSIVIDTEAPTIPTNLSTSNITQSTVDLSWDASTDNVGVVAYQIFEGVNQVGTTNNTIFQITGLTDNTIYSLSVKAVDATGNVSLASASVEITTLENTTPPITAGAVFINEIHYDNAGSDSGEGVEIAGPAGTDLTGWTIVQYNGNGGASYGTTNLSGVILDQLNGYGTIAVSISGLQNGSPDGVALVDNNGTTVQFLSYEGTFTATNGPASGLESTDIGISESSSEAVGNSLQLTGKGKVYNDFTWQIVENTFGAINTDQKFGDLVFINEMHYDNASTDTGEGVEIAGYSGTDLTDWSIILYNGSNGTYYGTISLSGIIPEQMNGYGTLSFSKSGLQNGSPDGLALVNNNGVVIQFLSYEGTITATNGAASGIESTDIGVVETGSTIVGTSLQLIGTGLIYSDFTWETADNTFGAVNTMQIFADPSSVTPEIELSTIAEARVVADETTVKITGVLTVSDQFAGSAYVQDETGAVAVFDPLVHGDGLFQIGDVITITGVKSSYNDQIQISPVSLVELNLESTLTIEPVTITLNEMVNHPSELVRILDPNFPKPGDIMFGNANYVLTDVSGTGELRIDYDVEEIVGLGQPETCSELIGVVGRYFETYQLLPRQKSDISCAGPYEQSGSDLSISKDKTLDIVTWNIEWFGDEANSPAAGNPDSDQIQKESVKNVLQQLNADIYGVEEVSDDALFAQMVSEMPGYDFVLSEATSYPNDTEGVKQKLGFIYNTNTVEVVSTKVLLESIHPYYNGGDESALTDFPDPDKSRFYASGRLPFMLTANVTIDGTTEQINVIDLHSRANTGDNLLKYNMRKYDIEMLKDSLDVYYPDANVIMIGDYNDDVDETVANVAPITDSTFKAFVDDSENYNVLTGILSEEGFRSYVSYENMIDHIMVTNELSDKYINESARVHYEFYSSTYTRTASDHFPVSARLQLKLLTLDESISTDVTCNGDSNGTATVKVSGGITPYTYEWSDGQNTSTAIGFSAGIYNVTVTDGLGATITQEFSINEPDALEVLTSENSTVYLGYAPEECTTLSVTETLGGTAPYTYIWSTGETNEVLEVCPEENTTYTVTVTDANGCTATADINITVENITCGNNSKNPKVEICHNGKSICVSKNSVQAHLNHGDSLGSCYSSKTSEESLIIANFKTYPNPIRNFMNISFDSNQNLSSDLLVFDFRGQLVNQSALQINEGKTESKVNLSSLGSGFYFVKILVNGEVKEVKFIYKE